jgi:hypothetical protein
MCGFFNVWVFVCVRFGMCWCGYVGVFFFVGVFMCGFCNVLVCVCVGFVMYRCVCVGFVMCGCVYVWVL